MGAASKPFARAGGVLAFFRPDVNSWGKFASLARGRAAKKVDGQHTPCRKYDRRGGPRERDRDLLRKGW